MFLGIFTEIDDGYGFELAKANFASNNVNLYTLSNYNCLLEQALDTGFINQKDLEVLSNWNSNPSKWYNQ